MQLGLTRVGRRSRPVRSQSCLTDTLLNPSYDLSLDDRLDERVGPGGGFGLQPEPAAQISSSNLHMSAIDEQLDAIDEAGLVGGEEEDCLGDLLGLADAAGGDLARQIVLGALGLLAAAEQLVKAGGLGDAGADRIDANAAIPEIEDPVARKIAHGRLAG